MLIERDERNTRRSNANEEKLSKNCVMCSQEKWRRELDENWTSDSFISRLVLNHNRVESFGTSYWLSLHISTHVLMKKYSVCEWMSVFSHSQFKYNQSLQNCMRKRVDISNQQSTHIVSLLSWGSCTIISLFLNSIDSISNHIVFNFQFTHSIQLSQLSQLSLID
jgi:hypothetical protein